MSFSNVLNTPTVSIPGSIAIVIVGVVTVHLVYKRHEPDPTAYFSTLSLLVVVPCLSIAPLLQHSPSGIVAWLSGILLFYVLLLLSITTYRLSPWHPLAKYPGPLLARMSMLWLLRIAWTGKKHTFMKNLHDRCGLVIRIGPNQLSVADADLIPDILGPDGMPKGPYWDGIRNPHAPPNLVSTRSIADHAQQRKPWSHALNAASIRDYAPAIARRALQLAEELEKHTVQKCGIDEAVNLSTWMGCFSFDFMGDFVFGGGFEMMRDGDVENFWSMLVGFTCAVNRIAQIPWITRLIHMLPQTAEGIKKFRRFSTGCALQRKERGSSVRDLFYYVAGEDNGEKEATPLSLVLESCELAIVAGSDTASSTLSGLFFDLLTNPDVYDRLQKEIDDAFPLSEGDALDMTKLSELTFLNAVINETLRIQPAVQTLQRAPAPGSGGKWIGKHFIPEGTSVTIQPLTLHRSICYFPPNPDTFWPGRWLQDPKDASTKGICVAAASFIPFSTGPAGCVGKSLALAEMRAVVALLVQRFEMRLARGYDPRRWEEELEDMFVFKVGELPVVLESRRGC
ncbi:hypothetical protein M0805_002856 [Coniferiporia weirii]|nr:hypothetical protein M0805_002856 [Coniferiporia weirii]